MRPSALVYTAVLAGLLFPMTALAAEGEKPATANPDQVQAQEETKDPLEPVNRFTFGLNTVLRKTIINPLIDVYQAVTPDPVEKAISNATTNLTEPVTAASSLLQGDTEQAGIATKRFLVNSTVGLAGTRDVAGDEMGLEHRKEDLGQAAGAGGMDPGPYLVLPVFGPSSTRDALGDLAVSVAVPPAGVANAADNATKYSENQDELEGLTRGSIDPYVVEREAYLQNRRAQVLNGRVPAENIPDFEDDEVKGNAK